jgi:tripartite-type tricarboxylate transporter receptor subunit TctC
MKSILRLLLALAGVCALTAANAQYPNRPIKFIMAYPPAGSSDVLARPIANEMTKGLGQPVLLEYKPGGGSTIAADFTAKSQPDGYTIVLLLTAHGINATMMPKLPYDTVKDFTPITLAAVAPLVVEVHADSPIKTLRDLIETAKANKGKLNYASAGPGNTSHLAVELFKMKLGIDMTHVPYKGSGPAITAILGREVDLMFDAIGSSLPQIQAGKFRAIAVTTGKRAAVLPNVPTVQEAGVPDFDVSVWYGVFAAAGTPAPIVQKLNAEFIRAMNVPEVKKVLEASGYLIVGSTPAELDAHLRSEIARWGTVVKTAGVTAQ